MLTERTIVAQATAVGAAGVGIVRLSGFSALAIANKMIKLKPEKKLIPREAHFVDFIDENGQLLDQGLVLYFRAPHSFTGEDTIELQGHGAQIVLQQLINTAIHYGAHIARPGEFSEQAFLNGKLDLLQAEAIADLISASSARAARAALQSLTGYFSRQVSEIALGIKAIRVQIEAAVDFSDEAIEPASLQSLYDENKKLYEQTNQLISRAQKGLTLNSGIRIGLLGQPNVGKSSLLNALLGYDRAMVTDIAGTTRDTLQESFHIEGVRFEIVDTAGLHDSDDVLEKEGMRRARSAIATCDVILVVQDIRNQDSLLSYIQQLQISDDTQGVLSRCMGVRNKLDLIADVSINDYGNEWLNISAEQGTGLNVLREKLLERSNMEQSQETQFVARSRHVYALKKAAECLNSAQYLLKEQALDLLAEELRLGQHYLGEIVGTVSSDELLGEIFSTFCIGK